jgi:hypothetical protein
MFCNRNGSRAFEQFLSILGDKVALSEWKGFAGGLDVSGKERDGTHSFVTSYGGYDIMYHVSTLLPYAENDPQQVLRKRHICNDSLVIVFLDSCEVPFSPLSISTQYTSIYIVVTPDVLTNSLTKSKRSQTSKRPKKPKQILTSKSAINSSRMRQPPPPPPLLPPIEDTNDKIKRLPKGIKSDLCSSSSPFRKASPTRTDQHQRISPQHRRQTDDKPISPVPILPLTKLSSRSSTSPQISFLIDRAESEPVTSCLPSSEPELLVTPSIPSTIPPQWCPDGTPPPLPPVSPSCDRIIPIPPPLSVLDTKSTFEFPSTSKSYSSHLSACSSPLPKPLSGVIPVSIALPAPLIQSITPPTPESPQNEVESLSQDSFQINVTASLLKGRPDFKFSSTGSKSCIQSRVDAPLPSSLSFSLPIDADELAQSIETNPSVETNDEVTALRKLVKPPKPQILPTISTKAAYIRERSLHSLSGSPSVVVIEDGEKSPDIAVSVVENQKSVCTTVNPIESTEDQNYKLNEIEIEITKYENDDVNNFVITKENERTQNVVSPSETDTKLLLPNQTPTSRTLLPQVQLIRDKKSKRREALRAKTVYESSYVFFICSIR